MTQLEKHRRVISALRDVPLTLSPPSEVEDVTCAIVTAPRAQEIQQDVVPPMIDILHATETGVGLAAPQVGVLDQFFVLKEDYETSRPRFVAYFNPQYFPLSDDAEKVPWREGCLTYMYQEDSLPGSGITDTERWLAVRCEHDELVVVDGVPTFRRKCEEREGVKAIFWQHETDHLSGVTIFNMKKGDDS